MKTNYVESNDNAFSAQMITFKEEIGSYVAVLKLTPDQVSEQAADADYFEYCLKCMDILQKAATQATAWKDIERDGGTPPPTGAPVAPALPDAVPAVAPGIEARFRALVKLIKANPAYNTAMGQALYLQHFLGRNNNHLQQRYFLPKCLCRECALLVKSFAASFLSDRCCPSSGLI